MERINKPRLIHRLNRVEGQVRGISRMVAQDRYCVDILTQLHAARAALRRVERELLKDHLEHCVAGTMAGGNGVERDQKTAELIGLIDKLAS
ncbi:metal-sensitive transcriptional regulator [Phenylobacterium sp. VNQ135]|uniref:metal-sensitive transcriptional regulator n=1 Tax=Phenylobacterium sp. VNQ135 TaxID=3400922 RepID=UPI003BFCCF9E